MARQASTNPVQALRSKLEARRLALHEEIARQLIKSDEEQYLKLAGSVRDLGDDSVADLIADLNLAQVDRELDELRAVEQALERMNAGEYGTCVDCGGEIELARLEAYPVALRCRDCQARFEERYAQPAHPRL